MGIPFIPFRLKRWLVTRLHRNLIAEAGASASRDSRFEKPVVLQEGARVIASQIGRYSYIGRNSWVGHTKMGRFCSIGPSVTIGPGSHPIDRVSTSPIFYSAGRQCGEVWTQGDGSFQEIGGVAIGSDVWIGAQAVVLDGVTIGTGAIIAAGAVVTKDVGPYEIVGGVPAKFIRHRFNQETIEALLAGAWWEWEPELIRQRIGLFSEPARLLESLRSVNA